jgi:hypothetical protein
MDTGGAAKMNLQDALVFSGEVEGWMSDIERTWLYEQASKISGVWVEVGTWKGRSFAVVAMGLQPKARLISVDTFKGPGGLPDDSRIEAENISIQEEFLKTWRKITEIRPDIRLETRSIASIAAAKFFADSSVDVVFIDADHSYQAVRMDIRAWMPKIKPGGMICGHDLPEVSIAVRSVLPHFQAGPGSIWWQRC